MALLVAGATVAYLRPWPGGSLAYGNGTTTHGNPFGPREGYTLVEAISSNDAKSDLSIERIEVSTTGEVEVLRVGLHHPALPFTSALYTGSELGEGCGDFEVDGLEGFELAPGEDLVVVTSFRTPGGGAFSVGPFTITYREGLLRHRITMDVVERGTVKPGAGSTEGFPSPYDC